jgi:hypothetical protein
MARRLIIEEILNLVKNIGGNPSRFMGTKTNINFLGKGPKEALFQGQIDMNAVANASRSMVISEAETAGGYAVGNKLNDLQLQRLRDNLIQIDKVYNPPQIANITDMATRTRDLTQEGLGSLRTTKMFEEQRPTIEKAMELGMAESNAMKKAGLDPSKQADFFKWEEMKKSAGLGDDILGPESADVGTAGIMTRISDRMKKIKELSDELGEMGKGDINKLSSRLSEPGLPGQPGTYEFIDPAAKKASYLSKFNPKNEVHVRKAEALLKDPQIKGLYTEAEVKNAYDFEGLYQNHFDKGHVDVAVLLEQAGHNIPQLRASARSALLDLMKKERGLPGAESGLKDFVDEIDFKFISEGGGGRAGDPINLFVKYFGRNAAENLPKNATKENIDKFTDFIMAAKDRRGRGIDDPFFDRETIDFSTLTGIVDDIPPFASGGRVGMRIGGLGLLTKGLRGALKRTKGAWDNPGADYAALMDNPSYLLSPVNMQKIKKLELYRRQLVRDILRKEGGGKFTHGPKPEATRADLQLLDDYIAELKNKIKEVGYYGEGAASEKALVQERPDLPFSKFVRDKFKHADGGRADTAGLGEILQVPRTSFKWGSGLSKALLKRINKKMIKDAVDDIFPTGDYKMDAEIAAEALVENNPRLFGGKLIDDLDDAARSDVYGLVLGEVTARFGLNLKKQRGIKSLLKNVNEQFGEGTLKRASELPKGTKYETLEAIKDFEARNRTFTPNREMIRTKYQGKIDDDLLDKILVDNNPQRIAEILATIDEALLMQGRGMGSQDIMAALRGSWGRKKSASGGLAKILEV